MKISFISKNKSKDSLKKDLERLHKLEASLWNLSEQSSGLREILLHMNHIVSDITATLTQLDKDTGEFHKIELNATGQQLLLQLDELKSVLGFQLKKLKNVGGLSSSQIKAVLDANKTHNMSKSSQLIKNCLNLLDLNLAATHTPVISLENAYSKFLSSIAQES